MARIVQKFGGTSVADVERIRNVARQVKAEADRGNEVAVDMAAAQPFDLILMDVVMPGLNGRDLARTLTDLRPGLRALFMSDAGVVIGWTHYLAFDLFTGLWIARDADAKGFGRVLQVPFLAATFIAGPVGLLSWLVVREPTARAMAKRKK